jgi:hypothetical protein
MVCNVPLPVSRASPFRGRRRAGNDLALFWFGSVEADTIVAYGTLSKR